ncbi:Protein bric-a-brac 2 [Nymphon striatum]|nr:Protein bric-a-brac 2 [Nymphon striatum]
MVSQQFCLKWNNHQGNLINVFDNLLGKESLVDVTLGCEGASIKAHKIVLSACSPFFEELFQNNPCKHPIVILKDLKYDDMKTIVQFMYKGEVNVTQDRLSTLLKTAENLKIKGLTEFGNDNQSPKESSAPAAIPERPNSPPSSRHGRPKRKKNSHESDPMESCSPEVIAESPLNQNSNRSPQAPSTSTSTSTQPAFTSDEHMEFNVPKTTFDDNYGSNKNSNQQITSDKFRINISSTDYEENSFAKQVKREKKSSDDEDIPSPNWTQSSNNQYQSNTINITNESQQPVDIIKPDSPSILPIQMEQEIVRVKESADFDSFDLGNSADSFSDQSFQGHSFSASMHESSNPSSEMLTDTLGNPSQMTSNVNSSQGTSYNEVPSECSICHKRFKYRTNMLNHFNHKHKNGEKVLKCPLCDQLFKWKSQLSNHLDSFHRVVKEFQCGTCGKYFHHYSKLENHHRVVHPNSEIVMKRHPK